MDRHNTSGFTLIELMVSLTIVAVISAIAVPLYTQYTQRSYRTEVQADMLNCVQALERFSAINFTYAGTADTDADGLADGNIGPIGNDICSPNSVRLNRYAVAVNALATTYTLTATPANPGPMDVDGVLTIDDAGLRTWDEDNNANISASENDWDEG